MSGIRSWAGAEESAEEKEAKKAAKKQANKDAKREAMTAFKRKEKEYEKASDKAMAPNATSADHEAAARLAKEAYAAGRALQVHRVSSAVGWRISDLGRMESTHQWNADKAKSAEAKDAAAMKSFAASAKEPLKQSGVGTAIKAYAGEGDLFARASQKAESSGIGEHYAMATKGWEGPHASEKEKFDRTEREKFGALLDEARRYDSKSDPDRSKARDLYDRMERAKGRVESAGKEAGEHPAARELLRAATKQFSKIGAAQRGKDVGSGDWDESKHPRDESGKFT